MDDTVVAVIRITLKGPRQPSGADSALTPGPATTSLGRASGSAAAPQVISYTEVEEQTVGAEGSVQGVDENDKEVAERARVWPNLAIGDLTTRFSKHVAFGRHGVE